MSKGPVRKQLEKASTELAKKDAGKLQKTDRPEFLSKAPARGLEEAETKDLVLPRLGLCQSTSPQRKKQNPQYIEGLEEGDFFNSITGEIYGDKIDVVPVFLFKSRIKFNDFEDGGGIDCQSLNSKTGGRHHPESCETCPFAQWGEEGEPPACTLFYNYACIRPTNPNDLFVVAFKSKSTKAAKTWNSMMKLRNADTFAGIYQLASVDDRAGTNDFKNVQVKNQGWVDAEVYRFAEGVYSGLKGKAVQVDVKDLGKDADEEPAF